MKRRAIISLAVIGLLMLIFFRGWKVEIYRDQRVVGGEIRTPLHFVAVHISRPKYLTVHGRTYTGIKGLPPYYLEVPALDSILFVTGMDHQTVHLVNLKTGKEIHMDAGSEGFGGCIGSSRSPGDGYTDFIESVTSTRLVATTRYPEAKKSFHFDLVARRLDRMEFDEFDHNNRLTNHSVYVRGELQR